MKKLLWFLLVGGAATGAYFIARPSLRQGLVLKVAELIEQEALRQGKPIDRPHLEVALQRFDNGTLRVFHRYVRAFLRRDFEAFDRMIPQIKAIVLPVIRESPEWERYEQFIFPT